MAPELRNCVAQTEAMQPGEEDLEVDDHQGTCWLAHLLPDLPVSAPVSVLMTGLYTNAMGAWDCTLIIPGAPE